MDPLSRGQGELFTDPSANRLRAAFADKPRALTDKLTTVADAVRRLVQLCASDPLAHYNLACRYARLKRPDQCLKTLRRAVELGYRDFRYMREDRDLDSIRHDPRFRQLLREYENR